MSTNQGPDKNAVEVTAQFLFEGAVYALQHSGTLLRDAVNLYEQGAYPSAIVLALFGREELGKFVILRDYYENMASGDMRIWMRRAATSASSSLRMK